MKKDLSITVKDIKGTCPVFAKSDTFYIHGGYKLDSNNKYLCMHALSSLMPFYSSLSFGAGGAIGSLYSGFLWNSAGPAVAFGVAAAVTVVAVFIAWYWVLDELDRRH